MRYLSIALGALSLLVAVPVLAADADAPVYDNGSVWDFGQVQTKDGHFDEYMHWLAGPWKAQEEALKKAGVILSYKVLLVTSARPNEPDIILAQEYANMAAFDRSTESQYALQKSIFGSVVQASKQQADRGAIRTVLGDVMTREAILK
jgi:hypothetical protein